MYGEYFAADYHEYVYLDGIPVASALDAGRAAPGITYLFADQLGTMRAIFSPQATFNSYQWAWLDNPFGEQPATGTSSFYTRFPGQYYDVETGLHYNGARYYDPGTGRYLQSDPIGLVGGVSTYAYVGNNPLMYRDPQGKELGLAVIGGLIGGSWGALNGYISGDRGWQLATDIAAGAGTGALAGLTNGASLIELAATRAVVSAGIESTRQIANGLTSPCHDVDIHGWGIAFAGIGSLVGDGTGAATGWTAIGEDGSTALGGFLGGGVSLPEATVEGAEGTDP